MHDGKRHDFLYMLPIGAMIIPYSWIELQCWLMFIFRRLKINHDSHEFILELGTIGNNYLLLFSM
jgi:hypothetical protein